MTDEDILAHLEALAADRGYLHLRARMERERDSATVGALSLAADEVSRRSSLERHHALSWAIDLLDAMIAAIRERIDKRNREEAHRGT